MDDTLGTLTTDLISGRNLFVVLYEKQEGTGGVIGCARIRMVRSKTLK